MLEMLWIVVGLAIIQAHGKESQEVTDTVSVTVTVTDFSGHLRGRHCVGKYICGHPRFPKRRKVVFLEVFKEGARICNQMSENLIQNVDQGENIVVSGYSLGNVMGMLLLGTKVNT